MRVGGTLQLLRLYAGRSLREISAEVGVSAAYLSRVEHGHDPAPTAERARALAIALGVPVPLLVDLVDEVRGDGLAALQSTPTGSRLLSALRRRRLTEAQLARVLALVEAEFPTEPEPPQVPVRELLPAARVLLGVRVGSLADALALAALRLADGSEALDLLRALAAAPWSCVGADTAVVFVRGHAPAPRLCVVVCEPPVALPPPDTRPVKVLWVVTGLGEGPRGAQLLVRVARWADERVVEALAAASSPDEALERLDRDARL